MPITTHVEIENEIKAIRDAPGGGLYSRDFIMQAFILEALRQLIFEVHVGHHLGQGMGHPETNDHPGHNLGL